MKKQIFAAVVVNIQNILYGISIGWAAPNMLLFQSEASPIGLMNSDQISLIVSLLCAGGTVGTILCGVGADYLGRKVVLLLIAIPQIIANVLLLYGRTYAHMCGARFLFGLAGGGGFIVIPMFVSEISHESIRGTLSSFFSVSLNLGIVIGYVLASWMDYFQVPYVIIAITVGYVLLFVWLPESPDYLAHLARKPERARAAYQFYGNNRVSAGGNEEVTVEKGSNGSAIDGEVVEEQRAKITLADFKDVAVQRGIAISFSLIILADTCGIFAIENFMTELFHWAKIELDVYVATIVVGVIQVVGAVIATIFVDRFGRRFLLISSCLGTAVCFYALGFYFLVLPKPEYQSLVDQLQWLPVVSIGAAVLIASIGIATLPFYLISELTPVKLRGVITSVSLALSWIFAFLIVQYYHALVEGLGTAGTFWFFATSCVLELLVVYFFLPETKNLSFDEIQEKLRLSLFVAPRNV